MPHSLSNPEMNLCPGVSFEEIDAALIGDFVKSQKAFHENRFVRWLPYNQVLPIGYGEYDRRAQEFEVRDDDVWVASYPKCGTTWTQEMVWLIVNDLNFGEAKKSTLETRMPYMDMTCVCPDKLTKENPMWVNTFDICDAIPKTATPRTMKTHLSWEMTPKQLKEKKPKVIYVSRNPRDACLSLYNHWRLFEGYHGTLETFVDAFLNDVAGYYAPMISHNRGYWERSKQKDSNLLFITYEDMKKDLKAVIRKVADFLGKKVPEDRMDELCHHLSFESMKANPKVNMDGWVEWGKKEFEIEHNNAFLNKGVAGGWRKSLSQDQIRRFETWEKNALKGSDLTYNYGD